MATVLVSLLAVVVTLTTQDPRPALPLVVTRAWIETSDPLRPGQGFARVEVLNTGQRAILAWGVKWVLRRPDGQPVGSSGFSTDLGSVPPENREMSLAPGQTAYERGGGALVARDSVFSDISLTFVIFDDDTALGDEREIAWQFDRRHERQALWQKIQIILDDATAHATETNAVLARLRQGLEAETDPKIREMAYYKEILARMSARRMEFTHMTPDDVLQNIQQLVAAQKANADAHANRRSR